MIQNIQLLRSQNLLKLYDNDLNKSIEPTLEKAEGSRGGKVIGHTKSGKPIYENHEQEHTQHYTAEDHSDAMSAHMKAAKEHKEKSDSYSNRQVVYRESDGNTDSFRDDYINNEAMRSLAGESRRKSEHHSQMAKLHEGAMNSKLDDEHDQDAEEGKHDYGKTKPVNGKVIRKSQDITEDRLEKAFKVLIGGGEEDVDYTEQSHLVKGEHKTHKYLRIENGKYIYDDSKMTSKDHQDAAEFHREQKVMSARTQRAVAPGSFENTKHHKELEEHHRRLAKVESISSKQDQLLRHVWSGKGVYDDTKEFLTYVRNTDDDDDFTNLTDSQIKDWFNENEQA